MAGCLLPLPMTAARDVLTPAALATLELIARHGSFAAAARELGKVPSALTYSVRQIEEALDVLLFDRRSRQARLTAAGQELLREGRRLLQDVDAVANRVRRVATGWEAQLTIAVDHIMGACAMFDLIEAFQALRVPCPTADRDAGGGGELRLGPPPTRLRWIGESLAGTWEALYTGRADLLVGGAGEPRTSPELRVEPMGMLHMVFAVSPDHPLARAPEPLTGHDIAAHRIVAAADSARSLAPMTLGVQPGQDVVTVPNTALKLEAHLRGLGCGWLAEPMARPHVQAGRLVVRRTEPARPPSPLYIAWRQPGRGEPGLALQWWLSQLRSPVTQRALLERHESPLRLPPASKRRAR